MTDRRSRRRSAHGLGLLLTVVVLAPGLPALAGDQGAESDAIAVIVYGDGRWVRVRAVEERGGAFVYTTMEGQSKAAPELALDHAATRTVNRALAEFATGCRGEVADLSWLFSLAGRPGRLFRSIANHYAHDCYQRLREDFAARHGAATPTPSLRDVAGGITLHKDDDASSVVITNDNAPVSEGAVTQGGWQVGSGYDHLAEYVLRSEGVVENECQHDADPTTPMYGSCVRLETAAVDRLKNRAPAFAPLEVFAEIRDACREKWPRTYRMRDTCEVEELNAYQSMERDMADPDFSPVALQGFRKLCESKWRGDYRMQRECLVETMESARPSP